MAIKAKQTPSCTQKFCLKSRSYPRRAVVQEPSPESRDARDTSLGLDPSFFNDVAPLLTLRSNEFSCIVQRSWCWGKT